MLGMEGTPIATFASRALAVGFLLRGDFRCGDTGAGAGAADFAALEAFLDVVAPFFDTAVATGSGAGEGTTLVELVAVVSWVAGTAAAVVMVEAAGGTPTTFFVDAALVGAGTVVAVAKGTGAGAGGDLTTGVGVGAAAVVDAAL